MGCNKSKVETSAVVKLNRDQNGNAEAPVTQPAQRPMIDEQDFSSPLPA